MRALDPTAWSLGLGEHSREGPIGAFPVQYKMQDMFTVTLKPGMWTRVSSFYFVRIFSV